LPCTAIIVDIEIRKVVYEYNCGENQVNQDPAIGVSERRSNKHRNNEKTKSQGHGTNDTTKAPLQNAPTAIESGLAA
jgi:hypothetical protein